MKKIILIITTLLFLLIVGCSNEIVCDESQVLVGTECCLDENDNSICDRDEVVPEPIIEEVLEEVVPVSTVKKIESKYQLAGTDAKNMEYVKIAAFNIQIFDRSKYKKADVMKVLSKTAREFDIMLIQEIRDPTFLTMPKYIESINAISGVDYKYVISKPVGRSGGMEQYAYVYNPEKVELLNSYVYNDIADHFLREPYIARFKSNDLVFSLVGMHADKDAVKFEIDSLDRVLKDVKEKYDEDNIVVLGDLNADCEYFSYRSTVSINSKDYVWVIPDNADTTVKSTKCAYDRIILTKSIEKYYSGEYGIYRYDEIYELSQDDAEDVSDRYPVWFELGSAGTEK